MKTMGENEGHFRFLHAMIRVRDLERSLDFYTRHLGMTLLRRTDYPGGRFTLAFVGYGGEESNTAIELTYNWDRETDYDLGDGFGHLAFGVADIYGVCETMEAEGVTVSRPPGPMKHGSTVIAFIKDPDGYQIELVEKG